MKRVLPPGSAALVLALAAGPLAADRIRLTDGKVVENVQVVSEGLKEVVYKDGKTEQKLPSEQVLAVEFEKKPEAVDEAERYVQEEDFESALDALDTYVQAQLDKPDRQFRWAPPYAAWKAVEVRRRAADLEGMKAAAQRVIERYADSRYLPEAYLAKAVAELETKQAPAAAQTAEALAELVEAQSLGKRWQLEVRLLQSEADPALSLASRRNEYERVAGEAKDLRSLELRARVAIGESYLAEAVANQAKARDLRQQARDVFQKIVADEQANRETLAAAYTGLGDSLFLMGADADDKAMLREAALQYLRVITVYREQGLFVPKAFFYAMRSFDLMQDPARKADMRRELATLYPHSTWAAEAKKY